MAELLKGGGEGLLRVVGVECSHAEEGKRKGQRGSRWLVNVRLYFLVSRLKCVRCPRNTF